MKFPTGKGKAIPQESEEFYEKNKNLFLRFYAIYFLFRLSKVIVQPRNAFPFNILDSHVSNQFPLNVKQ